MSNDSTLWHWRARLDPHRSPHSEGVVDGDTYDLIVDTGFFTQRRIRVRAIGIDTNEIYGPSTEAEYNIGIEQRDFVKDWFATARESWVEDNWPVVVQTEQSQGAYGRWLADIQRRSDGSVLREEIVEEWPSAAIE